MSVSSNGLRPQAFLQWTDAHAVRAVRRARCCTRTFARMRELPRQVPETMAVFDYLPTLRYYHASMRRFVPCRPQATRKPPLLPNESLRTHRLRFFKADETARTSGTNYRHSRRYPPPVTHCVRYGLAARATQRLDLRRTPHLSGLRNRCWISHNAFVCKKGFGTAPHGAR